MAVILPPVLNDTCISDIATDMTDVMRSTAAELAPRSKRPRAAQGRCEGPGVEAEMNEDKEKRRRDIYAQNPTTATFEKP